VVHLVDPNFIKFHRVFNPQLIITDGSMLIMWCIFIGVQIFKALQTRRAATVPHADSGNQFYAMLESDTAVKKEFFQYAVSRYTVESVNFLEETRVYRKLAEAGGSLDWKQARCRKMIAKFIVEGAAQEVNISHTMRRDVTDKDLKLLSSQELTLLFAPAAAEIALITIGGPWRDFLLKRRRPITSNYDVVSANPNQVVGDL
jgi:hypothetical protein